MKLADRVRRVVDVTAAAAGLIVTSPLLLGAAELGDQQVGPVFVQMCGASDCSRTNDALAELLAAPDVEELANCLELRPLLHHEDRWLLVHAGILPSWTTQEAESWARRVESGLASPGRDAALLRRAGHGADVEDPEWRALATFTRMRTLTADGRFGKFTGPLADLPEGQRPWFSVEDRRGDALAARTFLKLIVPGYSTRYPGS